MMFSIAIFGSFRFSFNLSRLEEVFKKLEKFLKIPREACTAECYYFTRKGLCNGTSSVLQ